MTTTPPSDASLDDLLALARSRYSVRFEPVTVGGTTLEFLQIDDMDAYIEQLARDLPEGMPLELPFWAKIWRTAFLVSYFVQRLEPAGKSMLEIGAGVGVAGLFAAARGFSVTITDIHPDALLFTRIAALKNGLAERVTVRRADFSADRLDERYDYILGSEVLYLEDHYRALVKFLAAHLKDDPAAEIILAKEYSRKAKKFFKLIEGDYAFKSLDMGFKGGDEGNAEKHLATIYRIKPRRHAQA